MRRSLVVIAAGLGLAGTVFGQSDGPAASVTAIGRVQQPVGSLLAESDYVDRLQAMWLAQSIANWTGLVTEGVRTAPPFFTDADWGTLQGDPDQNGGLIDFVLSAPWGADDDTDIEYIYLDAMTQAGRAALTAAEIRSAWIDHIAPYQFIWVSNLAAHELMRKNPATLPGSTSLLAANAQSLMIDAQLTTELFGAIAPGNPVRALELADLPIRTTASSYAAHAAQFHVALYSLAAVADRDLEPAARMRWLVETARRLLPDTSKAADVIDFCLARTASPSDLDDWEVVRDAIHDRYQARADANGFLYLHWYESPINLATGVLALLCGQGDLRRTIQIGTLSGWDSDNGTATMGGLLGLSGGMQIFTEAFPYATISDHYDILRTRIGFEPPDCVDWHVNCLDRFSLMAERMLPRVVEETLASGGGHWPGTLVLPWFDEALLHPAANPLASRHASSGSNTLRTLEVPVTANLVGATLFAPGVSGGLAEVHDGLEFDFSGIDRQIPLFAGRHWVAVRLEPGAAELSLEVRWPTQLIASGVRFVEGPRGFVFADAAWAGGFTALAVDVHTGGAWVTVEAAPESRPSSSLDFEFVEWSLPEAAPVTGVRLRGTPGASGIATISELEAIVPN